MKLDHRNLLIDIIPDLLARANFENLIRGIGQTDVLHEVPGEASYREAVTFILDAAIERGWAKPLLEALVKEFPNRSELTPVLAGLGSESPRRPWAERQLPAWAPFVAFGIGVVLVLIPVIVALALDAPASSTLAPLRFVVAIGAASLVVAIASIAGRKLVLTYRVVVMASGAVIVFVIALVWHPLGGLAKAPPVVIAFVRPDINARAMISPNQESPFAIELEGKRLAVPAQGVAIGVGRIPMQVMRMYHREVERGEPPRLLVALPAGKPTAIEVTYEGRRCKPLIIEPPTRTIWEFQFVDCPQ
jgi:hypothetical protein